MKSQKNNSTKTTKTHHATAPETVQANEIGSFVHINFTGELNIQLIKSVDTGFNPEGSDETYEAEALDISTQAVLCETSHPVPEGSVVALNFGVESGAAFSDILGLVKRIDTQDETVIMGIEFIGRDRLMDLLEHAELDLLSERFVRFDERMQAVVTAIMKQSPSKKGVKS